MNFFTFWEGEAKAGTLKKRAGGRAYPKKKKTLSPERGYLGAGAARGEKSFVK